MVTSNYVRNVAIVGAGGNSGKFMTEALLKTGKHTVTAITRVDSQSEFPEGVVVKKVDYSQEKTLVEALRGQDALVITLSGLTPKETSTQLINAAAKAEVPWILPNEWSPDSANEDLVKDVFVFQPKVAVRKEITDLGKSSYISVCTGFWYEWSLALPAAFGFDFANREVTFFDEGETKISISTWPQIGRAVASLLSLPITSISASTNISTPSHPRQYSLTDLKNRVVYINSFTISQREILSSILRITNDTSTNWTITHEPSHRRYTDGLKEIKQGKRIGYAKMMYTRVFFPDECGDFENTKGTLNELLDLSKEDLDEATGRAIERSKKEENWVGRS